MKKLKIGAELKTKEDVKDLILNLIDRASEFPAIFIKDLSKKYSIGSPLRLRDEEINQMVDLILYDMQVEGSLICDDGIFVKQEGKTL